MSHHLHILHWIVIDISTETIKYLQRVFGQIGKHFVFNR